MMFLEAQFGASNVSPIADPKLPPTPPPPTTTTTIKTLPEDGADASATTAMDITPSSSGGGGGDESDDEKHLKERQQAELARLHKLGIPVPGVRIKVDKMEASVWLEGLEVECGNRVFADRVRAVVERAVEVGAPLWG